MVAGSAQIFLDAEKYGKKRVISPHPRTNPVQAPYRGCVRGHDHWPSLRVSLSRHQGEMAEAHHVGKASWHSNRQNYCQECGQNRGKQAYPSGKLTGMDNFTMEPMLPEEAAHGLEDGAVTLIAEANRLAGRVHPIVQQSVGALVRSMNCYYSNLIEGHNTHPRDIERALANDFSEEPRQRDLQHEAIAHIHIQRLIDEGRDPAVWPATAAYSVASHRKTGAASHCSSLLGWVKIGSVTVHQSNPEKRPQRRTWPRPPIMEAPSPLRRLAAKLWA